MTASDSAGLGDQEKAGPASFPGTVDKPFYGWDCLDPIDLIFSL